MIKCLTHVTSKPLNGDVAVYFHILARSPRKEAGDGSQCDCRTPCLESQGCHLIPLYYLIFCFSAETCCLLLLLVHSPDLLRERKNPQYFSLRDRLFLVWLLFSSSEMVSWSVVYAAIGTSFCHCAFT